MVIQECRNPYKDECSQGRLPVGYQQHRPSRNRIPSQKSTTAGTNDHALQMTSFFLPFRQSFPKAEQPLLLVIFFTDCQHTIAGRLDDCAKLLL